MDGIEVLKTLKSYNLGVEVLIMSGHGTIDTAIKAAKLGAQDFIEKPFSLDRITESIQNILQEKKLSRTTETRSPKVLKELPVCFKSMLEVKKGIKALSKHMKPVLILGETGTGKESVAPNYTCSKQKRRSTFTKLNCVFRTKQDIQSQHFIQKIKEEKSVSNPKSGEKVVYLSNIEIA